CKFRWPDTVEPCQNFRKLPQVSFGHESSPIPRILENFPLIQGSMVGGFVPEALIFQPQHTVNTTVSSCYMWGFHPASRAKRVVSRRATSKSDFTNMSMATHRNPLCAACLESCLWTNWS